MNKRILAIGPITKDYIITPYEEYTQIGGAVFYQCITLNKLNESVVSIISVGIDDQQLLENIPGEVYAIKIEKSMEYINIYDENFNRKQKAYLPNSPILPEMITVDLKNISTALLSPLSSHDIPPTTISYLKENNIKTVMLPQGFLRQTDNNDNVIERKWVDSDKYLSNIDILCLDKKEAELTFNTEITNENINSILNEYEIEQVIITKAEKGSTIYTKKGIYEIPAIPTNNPIDATGLGDTYIAAYISRLNETNDIYESGLFAAAAATEKLKNKGPLKSNKEKIEKELDKYRQ